MSTNAAGTNSSEGLENRPGSKVVGTVEEALEGIESGMFLSVGGFGLCGVPQVLIDGVLAASVDNLSIASNNCGVDDAGLGVLLQAGRIRRMLSSYVGENKEFARQFLSGELTVELMPQGTLAEKLRAGGAGIAAFFTQAGVGTQIAEGGLPQRYNPDGSIAQGSEPKEVRTFDYGGNVTEFVLEEAIVADFALIHALKADIYGNVVFNKAARNFNPLAAMAGKVCVVQAEEIVEPGDIDPDQVHLPGVYVHRILPVGGDLDKPIEKRTVRRETPETTTEKVA